MNFMWNSSELYGNLIKILCEVYHVVPLKINGHCKSLFILCSLHDRQNNTHVNKSARLMNVERINEQPVISHDKLRLNKTCSCQTACLPTCLPVYQAVNLPSHLPICLSICQAFNYMPAWPNTPQTLAHPRPSAGFTLKKKKTVFKELRC